MPRVETGGTPPGRPPLQLVLLAVALAVVAPLRQPGTAYATVPSFSEDFTTAIYMDSVQTTASWNTAAGQLELFPFDLALAGTIATPGSAANIVVAGDHALVADGVAGLQILDISDPATPSLLGTYDTPNLARDVAVAGDHAFVADQFSGLQVIDISDPENPVLAGALDTGDFARGVAVAGNHAFVANGAAGLAVIDISDPGNPTLSGSYDTPGNAQDVAVWGNHAFVADQGAGVHVIDVSDPANPVLAGSYDTAGAAGGIVAAGDRIFVADGSSGLQVIDISDPANPMLIGAVDTPGSCQGVWVAGDRAFVADGFSGLHTIDITDPANPALKLSYDTADFAAGVTVAGDHAFVADSNSGLVVIESSRPTNPALVGSYSGGTPARGVAVAGDHAYVAHGTVGMLVVDTSDPQNPALAGTYLVPAYDIAASGDFAFLAAVQFGLYVIDISDPQNPAFAGSYGTPPDVNAYGVAVEGDLAFLATSGVGGVGGFEVVDISDPTNPTPVGFYDTPGIAIDVAVAGDFALVADGNAGLTVVDISDPANPTLAGSYVGGTVFSEGVAVAGDLAYLTNAVDDVRVVDISDPSNPTPIAIYSTSGSPIGVAVDGNLLFLADGASGLLVVDVSDPSNPTPAGSYPLDQAYGVAVAGELVLVTDLQGGLQLIQVRQSQVANETASGQSLEIDGDAHTIVRARMATSQTPGVSWALSADGGGDWSSITPDGTWIPLNVPGADLRWRSAHTWSPGPSAVASDLTLDWLNEFGGIGSITDVAGDQGGQVRITWSRSGFDFVGEATQVTEYSLYRRVDAGAQRATSSSGLQTRESSLNPPGWDYVLTVPADAEDEYSVVAPTLVDSTETAGVQRSVFMVRARVSAGLFFDSPPDSGYSIDNLEPGTPLNLAFAEPDLLVWEEALEEDFAHYSVYGSEIDGLDETSTLIGYTVAPTFDVSASSFGYFLVTTSDFSGNESDAASIESQAASVDSGGTPPPTFGLQETFPNPLRTAATIRFGLPRTSAISLRIFDVRGRHVRTLVEETRQAGRHVVIWDGRGESGARVAAGVYLARLEAGNSRDEGRVVVVP